MTRSTDAWPELPYAAWKDTCATLHLWTQIVGKVRLTQTPWTNHSWHVTLYVTPRGLTTSSIPHRQRTFEIEFDFVGHRLHVRSSEGGTGGFALEPQSVASFYRRLMDELEPLGLQVKIHGRPNEIPDPIPFDRSRKRRLRLVVLITIPAMLLASLAGALGIFSGGGEEPEPTPTVPQVRV